MARFGVRAAVLDLPNSIVLRQARVRGGKWRLQKRQRALFLSASTQRKNKKASGAIQFAFRRSWLAERRRAAQRWEKRGRAK